MFKLSYSAMALVACICSSAVLAADKAELAFSDELIACGAYYEISAAAIAAMDAPQMKTVAERLAQSAEKTIELAQKYRPAPVVLAEVQRIKVKQIESMTNASDLGALMSQYKDLCKTVIASPQERLDYWHMATM